MSKNEFAMKIIAISQSQNIPETELRKYYGDEIMKQYFLQKTKEVKQHD